MASTAFAGMFIGANVLSEFMPAKNRGRMTAWAYTIGFLGVPLAALLGGRLVARQELLGIDGWRWLLLFGGLGVVFIMAVRTMLPRPPETMRAVSPRRCGSRSATIASAP